MTIHHVMRVLAVASGLLLGSALASSAVVAQQSAAVWVSGSVRDAGTDEPLPGVNVFIPNTTAGTTTDQDGNFRFLYRASSAGISVVASMIGFDTQSAEITLDFSNEIHVPFRLSPKVYALGEVAIASSNKEWKRNLARLEELLFSTTPNGEDCTIENPEYLDIAFSEETGVVTATSSVPLVIHNNALGYSITIHDFSFTGTDLQLLQAGEMQFKELETTSNRQRRKWNERRLEAHNGSTRHFIGALLSGSLSDSGYEVLDAKMPGVIVNGSSYKPKIEITAMIGVGVDTTISVVRLAFKNSLLVKYSGEPEPYMYAEYMVSRRLRGRGRGGPMTGRLETRLYQASWLTLPDGSVLVDRWGRVYGSNTMERFGYWAWERLGEALPYDYFLNSATP